jgi:hypothetical protein
LGSAPEMDISAIRRYEPRLSMNGAKQTLIKCDFLPIAIDMKGVENIDMYRHYVQYADIRYNDYTVSSK